MARSLTVENLLPQNVGSIINYLQQFTEVAQWGAASCSRPQPGMDNGVRDVRFNWLVAPPPYTGQYPLSSSIAQCNAGYKSQGLLHSVSRERATFGMPGQRTACAVIIPLINKPTHNDNNNQTVLDLIWTNQLYNTFNCIFLLYITDNYPLFTISPINCPQKRIRVKFRDHILDRIWLKLNVK